MITNMFIVKTVSLFRALPYETASASEFLLLNVGDELARGSKDGGAGKEGGGEGKKSEEENSCDRRVRYNS